MKLLNIKLAFHPHLTAKKWQSQGSKSGPTYFRVWALNHHKLFCSWLEAGSLNQKLLSPLHSQTGSKKRPKDFPTPCLSHMASPWEQLHSCQPYRHRGMNKTIVWETLFWLSEDASNKILPGSCTKEKDGPWGPCRQVRVLCKGPRECIWNPQSLIGGLSPISQLVAKDISTTLQRS